MMHQMPWPPQVWRGNELTSLSIRLPVRLPVHLLLLSRGYRRQKPQGNKGVALLEGLRSKYLGMQSHMH